MKGVKELDGIVPPSAGPRTGLGAVFRIQDRDGRGPFKPGFTAKWADMDFYPGMESLPTWIEEFGLEIIYQIPKGFHFGSAVRTMDEIGRWFSPTERKRPARSSL